jgi:hypothetical protein
VRAIDTLFGQVVYLRVPRRQFYCSSYKKSPTESFLWVNKKQRQTNRCQKYIYERVIDRFHVQKLINKALNKNRCFQSLSRILVKYFGRQIRFLRKSARLEMSDRYFSIPRYPLLDS